MSTEKALLELLSDGEWHSGTALADSLNVSRTAVWKQLNRLMAAGVEVERVRGRGYRLGESVDLLSEPAIVAALPEPIRDRLDLHVFGDIGSTNQFLMEVPTPSTADIQAAIADRQTAGRGRRGRVWQSPAGCNIYLSLAMNLRSGFEGLGGLSLVAGLGVIRALESEGLSGAGLKWPNDVLWGHQKLAGILIELSGEIEGGVRVIVGVGVNVHQPPENVGIDQPWTYLDAVTPDVGWRRSALAARLTGTLADHLSAFDREGFWAFREAWQSMDAFRGRPVRTEPASFEGVGAGVTSSGSYRIETADGIREVTAGELSLRPLT
ncbi:biotin--[acetyl-CoA-carboxylase] ligase [Tamilnaduibacter salinus]|uniref:Bifunctional ligase/repressor BirA n=1 Tax=Tamilnaduibacter salinus TaxID=1484056 RepID=A0A2A2I0X1_9GAMM|nr:biotin--[acetyl-CoA-carboxylase] ligase [Tamilnaduibacter salinus]PAV24663.1 biotin--[acetyl-CoA-carboxylase] ligase [Tamilnaduibacter salinus]